MAKKPVNYQSLIKWIDEQITVSGPRLRERIKSRGHKSINSVIEKLKCEHHVISVKKLRDERSGYDMYFTRSKSLSEESNAWIEHTYGPLKDVGSMVQTLERHGYKEKKEGYEGYPRTYAVFSAGVLGSKVNWCEPCGRYDQDNLPEGGTEEELTGCEDSIQQEKKKKRGSALPIQKLYSCIEAQYARDIKTMGIERANWWQA